jgi:hypothetical protein
MLISLLWDMDSILSFGLFQQVLYKDSWTVYKCLFCINI